MIYLLLIPIIILAAAAGVYHYLSGEAEERLSRKLYNFNRMSPRERASKLHLKSYPLPIETSFSEFILSQAISDLVMMSSNFSNHLLPYVKNRSKVREELEDTLFLVSSSLEHVLSECPHLSPRMLAFRLKLEETHVQPLPFLERALRLRPGPL